MQLCLLRLSKSPKIQKEIRDEIKQVMSENNNELNLRIIHKYCAKLKAFVYEVMRYEIIVGASIFRCLDKDVDIQIDGTKKKKNIYYYNNICLLCICFVLKCCNCHHHQPTNKT